MYPWCLAELLFDSLGHLDEAQSVEGAGCGPLQILCAMLAGKQTCSSYCGHAEAVVVHGVSVGRG